ncbi:MAG TPA: dolichol kinase [Thermoplasmatales archaeon]|nr:dolichol kinase [Thermoplasmatales archaeon]
MNAVKREETFAHWYRRTVHAFGATFLIYYLLPDVYWVNITKSVVVILLIIFFGIIETMRIRKLLVNHHIFGLRSYEENRFGSYLYFGIGVAVLLIFFPQQIAIPSILCAAFADPFIGEMRTRVGNIFTYLSAFILCFFFFSIAWYSAPFPFQITVPVIGAIGAVAGEIKKFTWIDDDLLIQLFPAVLLGVLYILMSWQGIPFLPDPVIHPLPLSSWLV